MRGLGYWKDGVVAYLLSDLSQSIFATLGVSNCSNSLGLLIMKVRESVYFL